MPLCAFLLWRGDTGRGFFALLTRQLSLRSVHPTSSRLQAVYSGIDYDALAVQLEQEYSEMRYVQCSPAPAQLNSTPRPVYTSLCTHKPMFHLMCRGGQDFADYDSSQPGGGEDWDTTPQGPSEMPYVPSGVPHPPAPLGGAAAQAPFANMMALAVARAPGGMVPYGQKGAASHTAGSAKAPPPAVPGPDAWQTPSRTFRQIYVAQVGKFQFRLLHRMEGRWNGDATMLGARGQRSNAAPSVVSVSLGWDDEGNVWEETQSLTDMHGIARSQTLQLIPVADGVCKVVQKGSASWGDVDMELVEQGENVIVLTATSHVSGKPILVETVTVVDDMRRVRTVQRFDASGAFQCLYMFNEQRVIDAVSGALVPNSAPAQAAEQGKAAQNAQSTFPFPRPGVTVAETVDIDEEVEEVGTGRLQSPVRHTPSSTHRGSPGSHGAASPLTPSAQ